MMPRSAAASSSGSTPKTIELAIAAGCVPSAAASAAVLALSGSSLIVSAQPNPERASRTRRTDGWSIAVGMRRSLAAGNRKYLRIFTAGH